MHYKRYTGHKSAAIASEKSVQKQGSSRVEGFSERCVLRASIWKFEGVHSMPGEGDAVEAEEVGAGGDEQQSRRGVASLAGAAPPQRRFYSC